MKIIIAGNFSADASIERYYYKYLSNYADVEYIDTSTDFNAEIKKSLVKKILRRFDIKCVYNHINKKIRSQIQDKEADVFLVFKGINIFSETLQKIKGKGIYLVNYNPDHPFDFAGRGSGNKNITKSFNLYDLHISYSPVIIDLIKRRSDIKTAYLPFGFELSDKIYQETLKYPEINKVCFIGSADKNRKDLIKYLLNTGISVDVFGNGWKNRIKHDLLTAKDPVFNADFWINTRRYKVQLNIFRDHNIGSHNMRNYEVPGIGGILVTPYSDEQANCFNDGTEVVFFRDNKDCAHKISDILSWDQNKVAEFRDNARLRSITSKYTYKDRAFELYQILQTALKEK